MSDRAVRWLLRLFPEEFRDKYGPQIEADLYHPETNRTFAVLDILRSAVVHRLMSPAPYVWMTAFLLAGIVIGVSIPMAARYLVNLLPPRVESQTALWATMFVALLIPLTGTILLAIHWMQFARKMQTRCSKSRT